VTDTFHVDETRMFGVESHNQIIISKTFFWIPLTHLRSEVNPLLLLTIAGYCETHDFGTHWICSDASEQPSKWYISALIQSSVKQLEPIHSGEKKKEGVVEVFIPPYSYLMAFWGFVYWDYFLFFLWRKVKNVLRQKRGIVALTHKPRSTRRSRYFCQIGKKWATQSHRNLFTGMIRFTLKVSQEGAINFFRISNSTLLP
jgi:hypothetical protein